ncbi:uncharacterized protein LOC126371261 isoform X1 [Pectinophora gossypiella]|uniref:uncharacterized protein LOC126371261 isoform X1 n=1 Tax=Pectinophora gossypiella TaxID=13191 RepID=UPI00214E193F|nr:uncharacterized protein LOC126371261 isoform X1 [Pectinophora gossypiella]
MDPTIQSANENIREIEDIIDIQKANGNLNVRQVAFSLPAAARSLESGLAPRGRRRRRAARRGEPLPDVAWPSDSDVTVLRMRACAAPRERDSGGDGLHRPHDASSMVNLATLVLQSPPASKHSLARELLLPLSSWERPAAPASDAGDLLASRKSKLAKFLRLYFCPCCTCLYEMEKNMRDEPSVYLTTRRSMDVDGCVWWRWWRRARARRRRTCPTRSTVMMTTASSRSTRRSPVTCTRARTSRLRTTRCRAGSALLPRPRWPSWPGTRACRTSPPRTTSSRCSNTTSNNNNTDRRLKRPGCRRRASPRQNAKKKQKRSARSRTDSRSCCSSRASSAPTDRPDTTRTRSCSARSSTTARTASSTPGSAPTGSLSTRCT